MTEPTSHPTSLIAAQSAVVFTGDRQIAIDEWPLARSVEEHVSVKAQRLGDVLVIEPNKLTGAGVIVHTVVAFLGGALPATVVAAFNVPVWLSVVIGLAIVSLLLLLLRNQLSQLRWIRFNRQTGQFTIERRVGFRRRRCTDPAFALTTIKAVQLLYNGRHSVMEPQTYADQQATLYRAYYGYELNLVLDDPQLPRLNLFSLADWQWIRQTGQLIGDFLGVPVIDKLHHGG